MGVVLAAMLHVADVTGDASYSAYTFKNFNFLFGHEQYFRKQAQLFGAFDEPGEDGASEVDLPDAPPWTEAQQLAGENNTNQETA